MEKNLAKFISVIFHPLLFPTYYLLIILNLDFTFSLFIPEKGKWLVAGLVFIATFLLPVLVTEILGWKFKRFFSINGGDERSLNLATAIFFYITTYYFLTGIQLTPMFTIFILGATTLLVLTVIISSVWRISVYMISTGALFGAFLCIAIVLKTDLLLLLITLIFLAGFIGYSRLKTTGHTPMQVYSGFLLGTITMYLHFLYF
jgi:hypothetical protein